MTKTKKMAVAYLRVSTDQQAETGYGFELQLTAIRMFAGLMGYEIIRILRDAHTGMGKESISDRPGAMEAVEISKANRCPILVDKLERFSRNVEGLKRLIEEKKIDIIGVREDVGVSPAAVMSTAARSQREDELISEKTKKALQERKVRGVLLGNRKNLDEARAKGAAHNKARADQQAVELAPIIDELRQSGRTTARAIAEGLNDHGHRTARRGAWTANNIRRLLKKVDAASTPLVVGLSAVDLRSGPYHEHPLWGAF